MATALERGFAFELNELWDAPSLTLQAEDIGLFHPPEFALPSLEKSHADSELLHDTLLELPPLGDDDKDDAPPLECLDEQPPGTVDDGAAPSPCGDTERSRDLWTLDVVGSGEPDLPALRSWDAFEKIDIPFTANTSYLSEAGPSAYDAAIASSQGNSLDGVIPQDTSLRALCSLALGRSSVFYQWDATKQGFSRVLNQVPIAGYSVLSTDSVAGAIAKYGSLFRRLQDFTSSGDVEAQTPTAIAFKRTVASVLEAVEAYLSTQLPYVRSILELQEAISDPQSLLTLLSTLEVSSKSAETEEDLIGILSDEVSALVNAGDRYASFLRLLLARVCDPWLRSIAGDVGLLQAVPGYSLGESGSVDDERSALNISLSTVEAPTLPRHVILSENDRKLVQETRETLGLLRKYFPDCESAIQRPASSHEILALIEDGAEERVEEQQAAEKGRSNTTRTSQGDAEIESATNEAWLFEASLPPIGDRSMKLVAKTGNDSIYNATTAVLGLPAQDTDPSNLESMLSSSPFEQLRPLVEAQSRFLKGLLLRHLFRDCALRQHLNLQHAFHLFGNGDFVIRLSTALFSADTQSAERKRGTVPTGEAMGLRLGSKEGQRWPPASSELRLTLMGVLSEAHRHGDHDDSRGRAYRPDDLPGGLSFAIRELPDQEIDRVMDASSIYALDFLKLQYAAPEPLNAVLAPTTMQRYDEIFRFLLRMVRLLDVVKRLRRGVVDGLSGPSAAAVLLATEAHHVVEALSEYFMDVAIGSPWSAFQRSLDEVEKSMAAADDPGNSEQGALVGLHSLREMHLACLDRIRARLFLRQKQSRVREAIEVVQASVLHAATAVKSSPETELPALQAAANGCRQAVSKLVQILEGIVDQPPKANNRSKDTEEEAVALLLVKLNWNGRYTVRS